MPRLQQFAFFASAVLFTLVCCTNPVGAGELPQLTVDIRAESTQPAKVPILLTLTVTNSGDRPYSYTGNTYPSGSPFIARITDGSGRVREAQMTNDMGGAASPPWSGGTSSLRHGQTVDVPVFIDPLVPGSYEIQVNEGKSALGGVILKASKGARLTVKDDGQLGRKWDEQLVVKIRKGDLFARHVAFTNLGGKMPRRSLIDALLQDLLSKDDVVAGRAAWPLFALRDFPPNSTRIITTAMRKHLSLAKQRGSAETSVLGDLATLAGKIGTDEALETVLILARTQEVRGAAVWPLGSFKQEKAAQELRRFLKDENEELQFRAAQRLSERKDPSALEVLLTVAHGSKSQWRMYSFGALLKYPDDPRVEAAIKSGLNDTDSFVHQSAEFALRKLRPAKKP